MLGCVLLGWGCVWLYVCVSGNVYILGFCLFDLRELRGEGGREG